MKSKFLGPQVMLVAHSEASKNKDKPEATEHQDSRLVVTGRQDSRPEATVPGLDKGDLFLAEESLIIVIHGSQRIKGDRTEAKSTTSSPA